MKTVVRLRNFASSVTSSDIRNFFHGISIPNGGVSIMDGSSGDAFIVLSTDADLRQALKMSGQPLMGSIVIVIPSSEDEMFQV